MVAVARVLQLFSASVVFQETPDAFVQYLFQFEAATVVEDYHFREESGPFTEGFTLLDYDTFLALIMSPSTLEGGAGP